MNDRVSGWLKAALCRHEVWLFAVFALVYGLSAGRLLRHPSIAPHYVHLAESFLRGHTYLVTPSPSGYDLLLFGGRAYVPGGPLPALAFVPFVWLRGTPLGFPDAAVTCVLGACNVVLVYRLMARLGRWVPVSQGARLAVAVVFGAGTPHWYVASLGSVWFTAHVCAVTFTCLYAAEVLGRNRGWLAGLWLGLAGLARPTCWFAAPFFLVLALARADRPKRRRAMQVLGFLSLLLVCVAATLLYNLARFGGLLDFGYSYVDGAPALVDIQERLGSFSWRFAARNLGHMLLGLPGICAEAPWVRPDPLGMSIFLTTPLLMYAFKSLQRYPVSTWLRAVRDVFTCCSSNARLRVLPRLLHITPLTGAAWLSVLGVTVPLALYHNTGSFQFGYRYILDWMPLGLILVALGMRGTMNWWKTSLAALCVLINLGGFLWVYPTFNWWGEAWHEQWIALAGRLWGYLTR